MASTNADSFTGTLSTEVREKYISELVGVKPPPIGAWIAWGAAMPFWFYSAALGLAMLQGRPSCEKYFGDSYFATVHYGPLMPFFCASPQDGRVLASAFAVVVVLGPFGGWLAKRREEAHKRSFSGKDDQTLQVLHGELRIRQQTQVLVMVILLATVVIIAAIAYFARR